MENIATIPKQYLDEIKSISTKFGKTGFIKDFKNLLNQMKNRDVKQVSKELADKNLYKHIFDFYSQLFFISIKIYAKYDKNYEKYTELTFDGFKKIQDKIDVTLQLIGVFSIVTTIALNTLSLVLIELFTRLMSKNIFRVIIINIITFIVLIFNKVNSIEDIIKLYPIVKKLVESRLSNKMLAISFFVTLLTPYIEETFKVFCNVYTKLGLKTIAIVNILEEVTRKTLSKFFKSIELLSEELKKTKDYKSFASITPYAPPANNVKDVLLRILLVATTSLLTKLASKSDKIGLVLSFNMMLHFTYNSYILTKTYEQIFIKKIVKRTVITLPYKLN